MNKRETRVELDFGIKHWFINHKTSTNRAIQETECTHNRLPTFSFEFISEESTITQLLDERSKPTRYENKKKILYLNKHSL